ncbi:YecA family protein [Lysinibacillus odysseyi]|uniref:Metal-binding protein n=1 Tax=Lysinibacillus odysseyi 34hs-1 = NBRC 100172 TaxID=1220589 RepID=A0A0A3IFX9_9BACI|nr:SEC-C domain-containing protein [Lysinibacillus odysseyi]KGR81723.1 metal-binding protein [Lysinibacillus odysseyi 34hs-1 = NBRC 100172]
MVGRNDQCPCGSGKKYKKCCEGKQQVKVENLFNEEIESTLQTFYSVYPERKDIREYIELLQKWSPAMNGKLQRELIEAVVLDEFFFHVRPDIWEGYLKRQTKRTVRPQTIALYEQWTSPEIFIGKVEAIEERYFKAIHTLTEEPVMIRRENNKPIPEGMHVFAFLLPDGSEKENHKLAVSTLIFFPADHVKVFEQFKKEYDAQGKDALAFLKENHLALWTKLVAGGYEGEEFTTFEQDVLQQTKGFLNEQELAGDKLLAVLEDYLVEQQPKARKSSAIAAGAIRFGQERSLFEGKTFTVKEISESFGVSSSSLNKYYQELLEYQAVPV